MLLKQVLYFDRYVQLLAPDLQVVDDDRLEFMGRGRGGRPAETSGIDPFCF